MRICIDEIESVATAFKSNCGIVGDFDQESILFFGIESGPVFGL